MELKFCQDHLQGWAKVKFFFRKTVIPRPYNTTLLGFWARRTLGLPAAIFWLLGSSRTPENALKQL
jgi:hypothetical protein